MPQFRDDIDHQDSGFTLIEMLAVLVIISLMTAVVLMSVPSRKPIMEEAGKSILRQFSLAAQDSIISGQSRAFGFYEDAYIFYRFDDGEWVLETETPWPRDISLEFYKDAVKIDIPEEPVPLVVFEPIGLSTPFSLWIESDERTLVFSSDGNGEVDLETRL